MRIGVAHLLKVRSHHLARPTPGSGEVHYNLQQLCVQLKLHEGATRTIVLRLFSTISAIVCKRSAIRQQRRTAFFAEVASACRLLQSLELVTSITLPPMLRSAVLVVAWFDALSSRDREATEEEHISNDSL